MAIPYEKIVLEDLNKGSGTVAVTMPGGGTATGTQLGLQTWMQNAFNPRDFGAVGDGVADDTAAIQAAIDAAVAVQGIVYLPAGEYLLAGTGAQLLLIGGPMEFRGNGFGSVLLVAANVGASTDVIRVFGAAGPVVGLRIESLAIQPQSGTPARHGINLDATSTFNGEKTISKFVISHNAIGPFGGRAITTTFPAPWLDGVFNGVIRENDIVGSTYLNRAGDTIAIRDNTMSGVGPGIEVNILDGTTPANQLVIDHNAIVNANGCIVVVAGQRVKITNNNLEPAAGSTPSVNATMIDLQGVVGFPLEGITIRDNWFSGTPSTTTYHVRADWVRGLIVDANTFGYGTGAQRALKTTANAVDVLWLANISAPYTQAISQMFELASPQRVHTYLPRFGITRLGPQVEVINDTGVAGGDINTTWQVSAGQSLDLLTVLAADATTLLIIGPTGTLTFADARQLRWKDTAGVGRAMLDSPGDDTVRVGYIDVPTTNGHLRFYANGAEKARIAPSGQFLIGGTSPTAGALLDVQSTTQGFAPPRMTTTQRDAIVTPAQGVMIFNSSTQHLNVYDGAVWRQVTHT